MENSKLNPNEESESYIGTSVSKGQIRRVVDMDLRNDSRLVLVCKVNIEDDSAYVTLVNNLVEIATERDLLLSTLITGASFDLALLPDFKVRVWKEQIEQSPIFGSVNSKEMLEIENYQVPSVLNENNFSVQLKLLDIGSYIPEYGDHVWKFRSDEIDAITTLGHFENQQVSTDRFLKKWSPFLKKESTLEVVIKEKMDFNEVYLYILTNDAIRCERV
jgi:hypothetical protein